METFLSMWPLFVFITSLFFGGLGVAIGLTMWIMGRLSEQDARRIELKEVLLLEIRNGNKAIFEKMDHLERRANELTIRLTRVETIMEHPLPLGGKLGYRNEDD